MARTHRIQEIGPANPVQRVQRAQETYGMMGFVHCLASGGCLAECHIHFGGVSSLQPVLEPQMMNFSENTTTPQSMIRQQILLAQIMKRRVSSYGDLLKRVQAAHAVVSVQPAGLGSKELGERDARFARKIPRIEF